MQYSSETNGFDLVSDTDFWANTNSTSYPIAAKTRNANIALDRITSLIFQADAKWEFDDSNNTDLPIATTDLVAAQEDYSFAVTQLKMRRVRAKDQNGNWRTLIPKDRTEFTDFELNEGNGTPRYYDKTASSIFLHPAPSYASTDGLEIQFERAMGYFTVTDTTKTPGFASPFHRLVSLYMARDYCMTNDMQKRLAMITGEIQKMEAALLEFYSSRPRDEQIMASVQNEDYGAFSSYNDVTSRPERWDFRP